MSDHCSPTFGRLAGELGFSCRTEGGLVAFRNPFGLENWTLPVLEVTIILGAVLTLVYAINRLRRHGDPTNLVVWFGATAYLLIIEPPLYFPAAYGISGHVDTMFAHNVFSVDFLWGRLPLYIVAIYPFMATLAFETVRMLGVFRRYGVLVGAVCVGFVHHAYYEIFDQIGPQLRWWEWSTDNSLNQPMFDSVPLSSVVVFAALWPMSLALFAQLFVGRHVDGGRTFTGPQLVWRTIVVGILGSMGTGVLPIPATVFGAHSTTVRGVLYAAELVVVCLVAVPVLVLQWRRTRRGDGVAPGYSNDVIRIYGVVYLGVLALLWAAALPDFLHATHGWARNGGPTGNPWYTLACFAIAILCATAVFQSRHPQPTTTPERTPQTPAPATYPPQTRARLSNGSALLQSARSTGWVRSSALGDGVHVTPQELRDAAGKIEALGQQIDRAPLLHADEVAKGLSDTLIGGQLQQINSDSSSAKDVLRKRLREIANLLRFTADHYDGRDQVFAQRLNSITELNSGAGVGASQPGVTVPGGN